MTDTAKAEASILKQLLAGPIRPGRLVGISVRPARQQPVEVRRAATLIAGRGIAGDRYDTKRNGGRQVTLIASEALAAIASYLGRETVEAELLRRNLVTEGINLVALKNCRFRIGGALLEHSGECAPCSRMEAVLGPGGYNAVRGHGGITARIVEGGEIRIGDAITHAD